MASISKISQMITANSSQFDSVINKLITKVKGFKGWMDKIFAKDITIGPKQKKPGEDFIDKVKKDAVNKKSTGGDGNKKSAESTQYLTKAIGQLKTVAAGVIAFFAAEWVAGILNAGIETLEFSKRIGTTAKEVTELEFALKQTGQPVEAMREGLATLTLQLAKVERGNIQVTKTFAKLGISAEMLKSMNPTQAFKLIAEQISKIKDPATQAAFAFQIFGEAADKLLPLLQGGAAGINAAAEKARKLGLLVDDDQLEKLKQGRIALENIRTALEGFVLQVATKLAPYIVTLIELFDKWMGQNVDLPDLLQNVGRTAAQAITFVYNAVVMLRVAWIQAEIAALSFAEVIGKEFRRMLINMQLAMDVMRDGPAKAWANFKGNIKQFDQDNEIIKKALADDKKALVDLQDQAMKGLKGPEEIEKFFNDMANALRKGGRDIGKENKGLNKLFINKDLFGKWGYMQNEMLTPLEKFNDQMNELNMMLSTVGPAAWETYGRASMKALNELEQGLGAGSLALAAADTKLSASGVSAFNRAEMEQKRSLSESPQQRMERLQKQGVDSLEKIKGYSEETAKAMKNRVVLQLP